ncbi:hypothetical protein, partial [Flavobacterium sp.]|uniref:hypothetical protein n=1 Tax=Flavobacterium sp. TaxID=239 RepID=UPI003C501BFD
MRKIYPKSFIEVFSKITSFRRFNKILFYLAVILMSINSYGQCNAEIPIPLVNTLTSTNIKIETKTTGLCLPLLGCGISNKANAIDNDIFNYTTASFGAVSVGVFHEIKVKNTSKTYAAGTFAGFKIGTGGNLLSLSLLNGISIITYSGDTVKENFSGSSLLSLDLLSGSNEYIVGFNTNESFDGIKIVFNGGVNLLSSTNVYHAVTREYCAGPVLNCNIATTLSLPTFPVAIDLAHTGITGLLTVGSIDNPNNVISSSITDYASINLTVNLKASGSIAVKDQITDYPSGTYAGFEIENSNLVSVSALGNIVISTFLNGIPSEEFSGNNLAVNGS